MTVALREVDGEIIIVGGPYGIVKAGPYVRGFDENDDALVEVDLVVLGSDGIDEALGESEP